jgi:hypothetical protein
VSKHPNNVKKDAAAAGAAAGGAAAAGSGSNWSNQLIQINANLRILD